MIIQGPVLVGSSQGGMDIEQVAHDNPEAIIKVPLDIHKGLDKKTAIKLAKEMGFSPKCEEGVTLKTRFY
jgi:succinyl-CoA synthetase beta subunit